MNNIRIENERGILEVLFNPHFERYGVSFLKGNTQKDMSHLLQQVQEKTNTWLVNQVSNVNEAKGCIKAGLFYYKSEKVNTKKIESLLNDKVSIMLSNRPLEN